MTLRNVKAALVHKSNRLTTAPASEPVTTHEMRTHLRETSTGLPDVEANALIATAREWFEDQIGVALINQSWTLTLDDWPLGPTEWWDGVRQGSINQMNGASNIAVGFPRWPLSSVTSVTTYDTASNATVADVSATFDIDAASQPARMALKAGQGWPSATRSVNAISIVYVAGYGADATTVPAPMKRAILQIAAGLYSNRGDGCGMAADASTTALINSYKKARL